MRAWVFSLYLKKKVLFIFYSVTVTLHNNWEKKTQQNKRIIRWWKLNTHPQTHIKIRAYTRGKRKIKENQQKHSTHIHPHPHNPTHTQPNIRRLKLLLEWENEISERAVENWIL